MYADIHELKAAVVAHGGVLTMTMEELRSAHGFGRLGPHVKKAIADSLARNGLAHFPDLGDYQEEMTRVYQLGTPVADLVNAVLHPGTTNDARLRKAAGGDEATILAQVRALVCE